MWFKRNNNNNNNNNNKDWHYLTVRVTFALTILPFCLHKCVGVYVCTYTLHSKALILQDVLALINLCDLLF